MNAVNKLKKLFHHIPYIMAYCKHYLAAMVQYQPCDVLIDMTDLRLSRRMAQITAQIHNASYVSCLKISFRDYVRRNLTDAEYSQVPLRISHFYTFRNRHDPFLFTICHQKHKTQYNKALIINDNIYEFKAHLYDKFFFPILMHPNRMIDNDADEVFEPLPSGEKGIGILFIGNTEESYNKHAARIHDRFNLYSRREVVGHIIESFPNHVVRPENEVALFNLLNAGFLKNKIVIVDQFRVDKRYFFLYRQSLFHLWTSGFYMPYCHNTIESMACGTIPLYQSFPYYPDLTDGYNGICYQNFDELDIIINNFLKGGISAHQLDSMSKRTRELYETHYSKKAVKQTIDNFIADTGTPYEDFFICPPAVY